MGDVDFNPNFSFDAGDAPSQAPWEFGGAIKQALKETKVKATSIDDKIQKRLQVREAKIAKKQAGKKRPAADIESDDDSEDASGSDDDSGDDDDEDAPLPGEEDEDSEGEDDIGSDDSDGDALPGEMDSEEEEEGAEEEEGTEESEEDEEDEPARPSKDASQQKQQGQQQQKRQQQEKQKQKQHEASDDCDDGGRPSSSSAAAGAAAKARQQPGSTSGRTTNHSKQQQQQQNGFYAETPEGTRFSASSFSDLNLSRPLLRAVAALGYTQPTPIQAACIPLALTGRDICGSAITGSGKTAAFSLPILERLLHRPKQVAATYVLIISPTRELAVQIHSMVSKLAQFTDISCALIVGGLSLQAQSAALRQGPEIVVATPGRIIDHLRNTQSVGLEDLSVLVLDEADRLLEMGFKEELREIIRVAPRKRQTMLFSATFNSGVRDLMALSLKSPVRLAADAASAAPRTLVQEVLRLKGGQAALKEAVLLALCSRSFNSGQAIVFFKTKQRAHRMKILCGLCKLPPAGELHGDMTQAARLESLERFRKGEIKFLLATDVAARGLDIQGVQVVVNFDAPRSLETYLHRIGRTARAGATGAAVTFIEDDDRQLLKEVVKKGKVNLKQRIVPQQAVSQWQSKLERLQPEVSAVIAEEREEREIRKAEMEASKAQNMLDHEAEIYSRPARTWFQSTREKAAAAARAKAAEVDGVAPEQPAEASAKEKKSDKNARLKAKRESEAQKAKVPQLQSETEAFSKNIKSIKSKVRELVQQGVPANKASKIAAAAVTGKTTKHSKKQRKTGDGAQEDGGLFSGDGLGKPGGAGDGSSSGGGHGGRGGGAGGRPAGRREKGSQLSKVEINRLKRGGKGKKAFKSKKKHKRR